MEESSDCGSAYTAIQKHWGGRLEIGSANSVIELNNNANKKPPRKLQPEAIGPLQLLLQNQGGSELLGKMTGYTYVLYKSLRKGCSCKHGELPQSWGHLNQLQPSHSLKVFSSLRKELHYFRNTKDGNHTYDFQKALKWLFSCASPSSIKLSLAWHSDCIL